mmetsp:Transcript_30946/g.89995  ORF Transcript_30946/g.89995 Transcript_30946/m.89995 type:complete len:111 (+) Transcript_30946:1155-1487(+)
MDGTGQANDVMEPAGGRIWKGRSWKDMDMAGKMEFLTLSITGSSDANVMARVDEILTFLAEEGPQAKDDPVLFEKMKRAAAERIEATNTQPPFSPAQAPWGDHRHSRARH